VKGALVFTVGHAEVQRDGMPRPCRHAPEGGDIVRCRGDQPRRDSVDVVFRRKSQPINKDLNRGIDRGGGDLLISLRSGRHDGLERTLFGVAFPLPQHLDGEVLLVGVDGLAILLAQPNAVAVVAPLLAGQGRIVTRSIGDAAVMCAATPTLMTPLSPSAAPTVAHRQSGLEHTHPARFPIRSFVAAVNSSLTQDRRIEEQRNRP
jgi:hypothetical protein